MYASFLSITSYNKLTQTNTTLLSLNSSNTGNYHVSCRDDFQIVSSQQSAFILYQPDNQTMTNSTVANPGKYHIQDKYVIIEGDSGTITFGQIVIDQNYNTTIENVDNDMLSGGCQFFIYNNTVYGIYQYQNTIYIYDYQSRQKQTLFQTYSDDDLELLTLRSETDPKYIVIRQGKMLNMYNLTTDENNTIQLNKINEYNMVNLYQYFNIDDAYVNISTLLTYSRVTLFLEDYLIVQSQFQLIYHTIAFLRLSDLNVQCFNSPASTAFYFISNGISNIYGAGVFENTQSNMVSYDLSGILEASEEQQTEIQSCWLIQDCINTIDNNKTITITLSNSTNQQCQTCNSTPISIYYKDFYQNLEFQYSNQQYTVQYNTSFAQTCFEICCDDFIMVDDNNKLIGRFSMPIDRNIPSCYSIEGFYNLKVDNNFISYYSTSTQFGSTCMNDDPDIIVEFKNYTSDKGLNLPPVIQLSPTSLQTPAETVDYEGYLAVNLYEVLQKDCFADITITSYTPSGYFFKNYTISNTSVTVTVDNCFTGDDFMVLEYRPRQQEFVLRPSYTLTRFDHPCSMDTSDIQSFSLEINIDGYQNSIDQDQFTIDSDGNYIHEFYINSNLDKITSASLITSYKQKQYTPQLKKYDFELSCMFDENSFRFKNQDGYLVLMWLNSSKCDMNRLPEYDKISIVSNGETYYFDDYNNDKTEYYIEYDIDTVDSVQFYVEFGSKDIKIKSYSDIKVLDYNINSFDEWYIPFAVYCIVIIIFIIVITVVYCKIKPQEEPKQEQTESKEEQEQLIKNKQNEDGGIFEESQSNSNQNQGNNIDEITDSDQDSDSQLFAEIPKPKFK